MTGPTSTQGVRVLVVDDAPDVRRLVQIVIERHDQDWEVVAVADNGETAIEQARAEQPDLVLLDISMPRMDGLEALPLVRAAAPRAAVVMLTGFADDGMRSAAEAAGAHGYLEKEDLVRTLVPRLETLLADVREHVAAGEGAPAPGQARQASI